MTVPALAVLLALSLPALGSDETVTTVLRAVIECVLARLAFLLLLRSAREVDRLRERQVEQERDESLALARHRQEREYLALLHDTASATFLMVTSRGADVDPASVAEYARRDLAILTGPDADPLVRELSACVDVAERRGLAVSLAVSGETVPVPMTVRRDLTEPVIRALSMARSRARVSLLRTHEEVRVAVVADTGTAGTADVVTPDTPGVDVAWYGHGEQVRMEARWRSEPARSTV